jgi:hypothetical protein
MCRETRADDVDRCTEYKVPDSKKEVITQAEFNGLG